jgi:hypothetical protein
MIKGASPRKIRSEIIQVSLSMRCNGRKLKTPKVPLDFSGATTIKITAKRIYASGIRTSIFWIGIIGSRNRLDFFRHCLKHWSIAGIRIIANDLSETIQGFLGICGSPQLRSIYKACSDFLRSFDRIHRRTDKGKKTPTTTQAQGYEGNARKRPSASITEKTGIGHGSEQ